MPRADFFAALFVIACTGGIAAKVADTIHTSGFVGALVRTFDISVVVFLACILGVKLILSERSGKIRSFDLAVGGLVILFSLLPSGALSWLAVAVLSLYLLLICRPSPLLHQRGALILFCVTIPMLWNRLLLEFFPSIVLPADAALVAWMLGTDRVDNLVRFYDESGYLVIWPACSSTTNASLAFLCWITVTCALTNKNKWSSRELLFGFLTCASVIVANIVRLLMMGLSEWHYQIIHNPWSDAIISTLLLILALSLSMLGVRRENISLL
jgi:hypothetical protein